jgi:hypothetical protein
LLLLGSVRDGWLGFAIDLADFNGNGIQDLLMGAPLESWDPGPAHAGVVHLVLGAPDAPQLVDLATEPGAAIELLAVEH